MALLLPSQWNSATTDINTNQVQVDGSAWWVNSAMKSWSFQNPGSDNKTLRFEVRSGDNYSSNGWTDPPTSERSEIAGPSFPNGTTIYCSYDTTFLAGSPHPSGGTNWFVWSQFHQDAGSISPPFELDLFGEQMGCTINVAGNQSNPSNYYVVKWTDASNIVRGQTYHIDIVIKFDFSNGFLSLKRDGVEVINYSGPLGYNGMGNNCYFKQGIYRHANPDTQAIIHANLWCRTTPPTAPTAISSYVDAGSLRCFPGPDQPTWAGGSGGPNTWANLLGAVQNYVSGPSKPVLTTATGSPSGPLDGSDQRAVSPNTQAILVVNEILTHLRLNGFQPMFIQELANQTGQTGVAANYGLFDDDWNPKPAAWTVKNLINYIGDGVLSTAITLTVSGLDTNADTGVKKLLFKLPNNAYAAVVWIEPDIWNETAQTEIIPAAQSGTLSISGAAKTCTLIDIFPGRATTAQATAKGTGTSFPFSIVDHPLIFLLS